MMKIKQVEIYLEEHQGSLYAWRKADHQFLGQGVDVQALFERMADDVPDNTKHVYICTPEDGADLLQRGGSLKYQYDTNTKGLTKD